MATINLAPYKPAIGTDSDANLIDNAFDVIQAWANGGIDNNNFAAGKIFDPAKIMQSGATSGQALAWSSGSSTFVPTTISAPSVPNPDKFVARQPWDASGTLAAQSLAVANKAWLTKSWLPASFVVTSLSFVVVTQSGNMDIGIYDSTFTRVWSRGSFAVPAAGTRAVLISAGSPATLTLAAGTFYIAWTADNTTALFTTLSGVAADVDGQSLYLSKTSSLPLPASIVTPTDETINTAARSPLVLIA